MACQGLRGVGKCEAGCGPVPNNNINKKKLRVQSQLHAVIPSGAAAPPVRLQLTAMCVRRVTRRGTGGRAWAREGEHCCPPGSRGASSSPWFLSMPTCLLTCLMQVCVCTAIAHTLPTQREGARKDHDSCSRCSPRTFGDRRIEGILARSGKSWKAKKLSERHLHTQWHRPGQNQARMKFHVKHASWV